MCCVDNGREDLERSSTKAKLVSTKDFSLLMLALCDVLEAMVVTSRVSSIIYTEESCQNWGTSLNMPNARSVLIKLHRYAFRMQFCVQHSQNASCIVLCDSEEDFISILNICSL